MNDLSKAIFIGFLFIIGIGSFIYSQFVVSTVAFAASALYGNVFLNTKPRR
ncbi:MAG: hypothetical protein ACU84H_03955 [Gammaproteobacteria bacterium]